MALKRIGLMISQHLHHFRSVLRGIKEYAATKPHWMFLPVSSSPQQAQALRASRPDGLIAQVYNRDLVPALKAFRRPVVNVSRVVNDIPFPNVSVNEAAVGELAARHLLERGFRNFAFVGHMPHQYVADRAGQFEQTLAAAGFRLNVCNIMPEMSTLFWSRPWSSDRAIVRWLTGLPKPVAVFAANDQSALQVAEVCRLIDLRVPEDVALVGVDNDEFLCELARPSLSSVSLPGERIGYEAAALLDRLMNGRPQPRKPVLLAPLGIVVRRSSDLMMIADPDVAAALRFIHAHGDEPLRVADVLRAVPLSRRGLERRFRKTLKRTISQEIRRAHLESAKLLLSGTELSMAEVAAHAGFSDGTQLSVAVRKQLGCTPTQYRRQFRGEKSSAPANPRG